MPSAFFLLVAEPREHHPVSATCPHVLGMTAVLLRLGRGGASFDRSAQTRTWVLASGAGAPHSQ